MISVLQLPHLPDHVVCAALFNNVTNAAFLRQQLLQGNADFEYAFIDASSVVSTKHVLGAVFRAVNDSTHHRLKSRNVHSEIVFALSPNNNIADSFRRFGVGDTTTDLIAIKICPAIGSKEEQASNIQAIKKHLEEAVKGDSIAFNDECLSQCADLPKIQKLYKTSSERKIKITKNESNGLQSKDAQCHDLEGLLLGMMAIKGS